MKNLAEFQSFFEETLAPALEEVEARRKGLRKAGWISFLTGVIIVFVHFAILYLFSLDDYYWTLAITLLITPPAIYFIFRNKFYDDTIAPEFKDIAVRQMVSFMSDALDYDPDGYVPYEEFQDSELYPLVPDHYIGDDFMTGEIDGHPAQLSELLVQIQDQSHGAKEKNNWITSFKGLFMVVDVDQEFPHRTFVFSDKLQQRYDYTGRLIQAGNSMYGYYVNSHRRRFSDRFVVYCEDDIEGERLLTERFMDELLQLQYNTKSNVHISLLNGKMYVAIERKKDFFEVDLSRSMLDFKYIVSFYRDLYLVFNMVNDLNVNDMFGGESENIDDGEGIDEEGGEEEGEDSEEE